MYLLDSSRLVRQFLKFVGGENKIIRFSRNDSVYVSLSGLHIWAGEGASYLARASSLARLTFAGSLKCHDSTST